MHIIFDKSMIYPRFKIPSLTLKVNYSTTGLEDTLRNKGIDRMLHRRLPTVINLTSCYW